MKNITNNEFLNLCQQKDIKIIKCMKDKRPRVLETKDGNIIKLFYQNKKAFLNFCKNADYLLNHEILAPRISEVFYYADLNVYLVIYKKMSGDNVRAMIQKDNNREILNNIAVFIAKLHQKGIFFRSLHLENLICQSANIFSLIDIADVYFKPKPLNAFIRYRNLRHMFLVRQDKEIWREIGFLNYLKYYFQFTELSPLSKAGMLLMMKMGLMYHYIFKKIFSVLI